MEKCAYDDATNRQLFALEIFSPTDLPTIELNSPHFVALIAWDASGCSVEDVCALIDPLIKAGCVYFCCWGPDCERVHDIIDESVWDTENLIMTTWHSDETLENAIWFLLNVTSPDAEFEATSQAAVGITVGSSQWASAMRSALLDPRAFRWRSLFGGEVSPGLKRG